MEVYSRFFNFVELGPERKTRDLCIEPPVPFDVAKLREVILHDGRVSPVVSANILPIASDIAEMLERAGLFSA